MHNPDLVIMSDAWETDWIAVMEDIAKQGFWSQDEVKLHIDQLELRAAGFGFQAFMKNMQHLHVHLRMDNKMAVAYVNKQGVQGNSHSCRKQRILRSIVSWAWSRLLWSTSWGAWIMRRIRRAKCAMTAAICKWIQHFHSVTSVVGADEDGFIRGKVEHTTGDICKLQTGLLGEGNRCFLVQLVEESPVCVPTILPGKPMPGKNWSRTRRN